MKMPRGHRVPLCGRALEILAAARTLADGASPLVFPRGNGTPLSQMTLWRPLRAHGIAAVPHGFRSSFRDWAAEERGHRGGLCAVGPVRTATAAHGRVGLVSHGGARGRMTRRVEHVCCLGARSCSIGGHAPDTGHG